MQSHELLREVFHEVNAKKISAEMGLSLAMIYKWAEPPGEGTGSGAANPLDRLDALVRCTGEAQIVQWLCQRAGGFLESLHDFDAVHWDHELSCGCSAGVLACEFTGRLARCSCRRRDTAATRSRDGCVTRFMESLLPTVKQS